MLKNRSNTEAQNRPFMEELTWEQAREDVIRVNPEFANIIDELSPGKEYTLFKARYPYGSEILKRGDLCLPNGNGEIVPLHHPTIADDMREKLNYNLDSNPVTLVLRNSLELFANLQDRTIPLYGMIPQGKIFGLWRILNPNRSHQPVFIWDMTAGARSIFMLPKISEAEKHKKLKKTFYVNADTPRSLICHWQVFREIANHPYFPQPWYAEVLFFSKKWFEHLNDPEWLKFNYYLLKSAWLGSEFWRNQFFWNLIFSIVQKIRDIKPSPYVTDTVKYLFAISVGELPGFAPALDDSCAPIQGIQKAYLEIYDLKSYAPIIMQPSLFDMNDSKCRATYYSLQYPNAVELGPKSRSRSSLITDLYEIKSLLTKYLSELNSGQFNLEGTPLHNFIKLGGFDYFHDNAGPYYGIQESGEIPKDDDSFLAAFKNSKNNEFPSISTFVRGCIKISLKK